MGSAAGSEKAAARRVGVTVDGYRARVAAGQKWCHACASWVDQREFGRDPSRGDGLSAVCSGCRVVATGRPGARERRQRASKGEAWCRGCETWLPASEVRSGVCRPHANEEYRRHYAAKGSPAIRARATARRRGLDVIPPWWWADTLIDWDGLCAYGCGRPGTQREHVQPVARGGRSVPGNVVPACGPCNSSKKDGDPIPWVDRGFEALPDQWVEIAALALEHGTDEWLAVA